MTNFGKLAYNKVKDIERENLNLKQNFSNYCFSQNLSTTSNFAQIKLTAFGEAVIFTINLQSNASVKVFVNSNLQYCKLNFNYVSFPLFLTGENTIKFEFSNVEETEVKIGVLGNFKIKNEKQLCFVNLPNSLNVIEQFEQSFNTYSGGNVSELVSNFNGGICTQLDGQFLGMVEVNDESYLFYNNNSTILKTSSSSINLLENLNKNSCFFESENEILCITKVFDQLQVKTILVSGEITNYSSNGNISFFKKIKKISPVCLISGTSVYFVCTDVNFNNYIVLCNINKTTKTAVFLLFYNIGVGEHVSAVKTSGTTIMVSTTSGYNTNVKTLSISQNNLSLVGSVNFNNLTQLFLVDNTNQIFNFDGTLVENNFES